MKKYKAIISDFDGTLAGRDGVISTKLVKAIHMWMKAENHFSIATGRQFIHIKDQCKILGLTSPQIVRGASEIVDPTTGTLVWHEYIPKEDIKRLVALLIENKIPFNVEKGMNYYSLHGEAYHDIEQKYFQPITHMPYEDMPTIVMIADTMDEQFMEQFVKEKINKEFKNLFVVKTYNPKGKTWGITSEKATKHLALLHLSKLINISLHEMIGIGDSYNDYPLLSACGFKVAMGNAPQELKDIADFIAPPYQEDGVATVIEKFTPMSS